MLGYQLAQDQRLKLAVTPELKQSIHILSLSTDELLQYLQEQATENPVLEFEFSRSREAFGKRTGTGKGGAMTPDPLWCAAAKEDTMEEKLLSQLRLLSLPSDVFKAAAYLVSNLNENGYLNVPLTEIAGNLKVAETVVEMALEKLQSLEPSGYRLQGSAGMSDPPDRPRSAIRAVCLRDRRRVFVRCSRMAISAGLLRHFGFRRSRRSARCNTFGR